MPSAIDEDALSKSLLSFVVDGKYPDSEDVVSADFTPSFIPKGIQDISEARAQVEDEISYLTRDTASDVDGWISQARQLRADIERSCETARDIVAQHERTQPLHTKVKDAAAKLELMKTELAFNEAVTQVLEEVRDFTSRISDIEKTIEGEQIDEAITSLEAANTFFQNANLSKYSNISSIVQERLSVLRNSVVDLLLSCWARQVRLSRNVLEICTEEQYALSTLITSFSSLDILDTVNSSFEHGILGNIVQPILMINFPGQSCNVTVGDHGILVGEPLPSSIPEVLDRLILIFQYIHQKLPTSMSQSVAEAIIPKISADFSKSWLTPNIPLNLNDIQNFENTLVRVNEFCNTIESFGWHGQEELISWVNHFPRLWLTCRRVDSLDHVRRILVQSKGTTKEVQRVEKQVVAHKDDVLLDTGVVDDWDANWDNDESDEGSGQAAVPKESQEDDEDVDAWGLGEETDNTVIAPEEDDDNDAWGWGDDDGDDVGEESIPENSELSKPAQGKDQNHDADQSINERSSAKEVTLTEHYTITDIPDFVIALIQQQIIDSESLSKPEFSSSRVAASGNGLLALPTLILAMFKAIAPSFYSLKLNAGNIYLYNDSLYLAEQVRSLVEDHQLTRLTADIEGLERFGKISYSKEMQTQRTIVTDLLDGSQGFAQCSEQPFLREYENAVDATVDRIRSVFMEWQPILSHSALLQAIGSLLSTVINKVIIDIEDLSDISEAESHSLVAFCNKISTLEDIFVPDPSVGATSMAAVYVRNWLRFQYLIQILESSLADIKFLWIEGELHLEFAPEEVTELITALFAESDHRRKTIAEIKRTHH